MDKELTLDQLKDEVHKLDPQIAESEDYFKTAVMLLAALQVGPDVKKVAAFTSLPESFVQERATRLETAGIWKDGQTVCDWFNEELGGTAFWMDVAVAEGLLGRAGIENDHYIEPSRDEWPDVVGE